VGLGEVVELAGQLGEGRRELAQLGDLPTARGDAQVLQRGDRLVEQLVRLVAELVGAAVGRLDGVELRSPG
jgi:hypothetical protein